MNTKRKCMNIEERRQDRLSKLIRLTKVWVRSFSRNTNNWDGSLLMRMPINECSWVQTVWCLLKTKASNHLFLMTNDKLGGFFFCVSDSYLVISSLWSGDIRIDEIWFFITLHSLIAEGYRSYKIIIKKLLYCS